MRFWCISSCAFLISFGLLAACGGDDSEKDPGSGSQTASACERVCTLAADIACGADDCVSKCETPLPVCDEEYREVVSCMAETGVACADGRLGPLQCDTQSMALTQCLLSSAGGAGGNGQEPVGTDCEKLCAKSKSAGCEPTDCIANCEAPLPACDAEFDAVTACGVSTGSITCNGNKPKVEGCDTETTAFLACVTGEGESCYAGQGQCDPRDPASCPAGEACDIGEDDQFSCFPPPNDVPIGGSCSIANGPYCVPGSRCGPDDRCQKWCCSDADCGGTSCVTVATADNVTIRHCEL